MGLELGPTDVEKNLGSLYLFNLRSRTAKPIVPRISTANGLAWNLAKKKMYFLDSTSYAIEEFEYDSISGNIRK